MKQTINVRRPIQSLTLAEMEGMAEAATAKWIVLASRRMLDQPPTPDKDDIEALLI